MLQWVFHRGSISALIAVMLVVLSAGCAAEEVARESSSPGEVEQDTTSPRERAQALREASCGRFTPRDAVLTLVEGFDANDIKHINEALELMEAAAEIDAAPFASYHRELLAFAEELGRVAALQNSGEDPMTIIQAFSGVPMPTYTCPEPGPDSGGLPLPEDMSGPST